MSFGSRTRLRASFVVMTLAISSHAAYAACPAPAKMVVDQCNNNARSDLQALQLRGVACAGAREYARAIEVFTQAHRVGCPVSICVGHRGRVKLIIGDVDGALADFDEASRAKATHKYRAMAHYKKGEFDRAIADADDALRGSGDDAEALYVRGLAKIGKGDVPAGRADQEAAQNMDARSKFPIGNLQLFFECTYRI